MSAMPRVLVCMPAYGHVTPHTTQSLFTLGQWFASNGIRASLSWFAFNGIEDARNTFLTIWYDHYPDCTHMLMVDSDMGFPYELIADMMKFDKPVTGCFYAKRQMPAEAVGQTFTPHDTNADVVNGFLKVKAVGAGVLLVKRSAIDTMIKKLPGIVDNDPVAMQSSGPTLEKHGATRFLRAFDRIKPEGKPPMSEDISFCERWRQCDGEIWANVNHLIDHVGPFNFAIRYADFLDQQDKDRAAA